MTGALSFGKGHLIGIIVGIVLYELWLRQQKGSAGP